MAIKAVSKSKWWYSSFKSSYRRCKSFSGGFNFKSSEFNRVTQAKRQPGSAFKPIVYAAALENGFSPNSIILDAPFVESQGVGLKIGNLKIMERSFMVHLLLEKELNIQETL